MGDRKLGYAVPNWVPPPAPSGAVLTGRFTRLEPLSVTRHGANLFEANSRDDAIWDYLPYGPFETQGDYDMWLRQMEASPDPKFYAVCDAQTGDASGVASLMRINATTGVIEVGHINFASAMQRRPLGSEAIFLMMKWVFEAGYRRFEWKCDALNLGSRRAAQRFGFSYEGTFRQATMYKGRNRDTAWFAAIDAEWPALRRAFETWLASDNFDHQGNQRSRLSDLTRAIRVADDPCLAPPD